MAGDYGGNFRRKSSRNVDLWAFISSIFILLERARAEAASCERGGARGGVLAGGDGREDTVWAGSQPCLLSLPAFVWRRLDPDSSINLS